MLHFSSDLRHPVELTCLRIFQKKKKKILFQRGDHLSKQLVTNDFYTSAPTSWIRSFQNLRVKE